LDACREAWLIWLRLTSGESILEDLLETQEFQDGKIDGRVESETTLVRTKGGVELNSVSAVDLALALVIFPDDTELNDTLGDGGDLEGLLVLGVLLEEGGVLEGRDQLWRMIIVSLARRTRSMAVEVWAARCECGSDGDSPL
jgi:hypothetical protein